MQPITAIVLAAGKGSRFGGDKMLHKIDGQAMGLVCAKNVEPHVDRVICVVRPDDLTFKKILLENGFEFQDNPEFEQGMSTSIKTGVMACNENSHILMCLGDMPFIKSETYHQVVQHFRGLDNANNSIARPYLSQNGKENFGHPVLFGNAFKSALLELKGDEGAKKIIRTNSIHLSGVNEVHNINTDDAGILKDLDTPPIN